MSPGCNKTVTPIAGGRRIPPYDAEPLESLSELAVWGRAATALTEGRPMSGSQTHDEKSKRRMLAYLILGK
jgi:hypothetical protein